MQNLKDKRVAILTTDGFEEDELTSPKKALEKSGATVHIVSPKTNEVRGWKKGQWTISLPVDITVSKANPEDYDAIMIPGGVINPDKMRRDPECIAFARSFLEAGKPVAAICHGPQLLIETGLLRDRKMTSFSSIKTDLINRGAEWKDEEVVTDHGLVTSRSPADLDAFNTKMIEEISEGIH